MTAKLTLSIETSILAKGKSYAKKSGKSLSKLIENYLEILTEDRGEKKISPKLRKIIGAVKLPRILDEEKELRAYVEKKHFNKSVS